MDGFPSGQRGQTVNLLSVTSVVRIHPHPFNDPYYGLFYILSAMIGALDVAGWSSLEARRAHNPKVVGSNFKSYSRYFAQIAQLVEQRTENPRVTGSIPVLGISKNRLNGGSFHIIVNFDNVRAISSVGRALDF